MKNKLQVFAVMLSATFCICCAERPATFTERRVVIASKETVRIPEIQLSITNNGCGRKWVGDEERPYCELIIKHKNKTVTAGGNFSPVYIGNIRVTIDRMNPWGVMEDSVPPGGCRVVVTKLPDNSR